MQIHIDTTRWIELITQEAEKCCSFTEKNLYLLIGQYLTTEHSRLLQIYYYIQNGGVWNINWNDCRLSFTTSQMTWCQESISKSYSSELNGDTIHPLDLINSTDESGLPEWIATVRFWLATLRLILRNTQVIYMYPLPCDCNPNEFMIWNFIRHVE